MMWTKGYWRVGTYRGAPLRLHWSLPVGLLLFGRFELAPIAWLTTLALFLVHEAGHASLVRQHGLRVNNVDLTGLGGECRWIGSPTVRERVFIAWGGVIAQTVALVVVQALVLALGEPSAPWLVQVVDVYTRVNLWLIAINLLPLPHLDGAVAWEILPGYRRWRLARGRGSERRVVRAPRLRVVNKRRAVEGAERDAVRRDVDQAIRDLVESHNAQATLERDRTPSDDLPEPEER